MLRASQSNSIKTFKINLDMKKMKNFFIYVPDPYSKPLVAGIDIIA